MDNWLKLVTLSIMVLVCGCLESYHFAVLIFLLFSIGLVFRQMNISVLYEASSSSSSTSSSSSSSISVPDEASSSSSSTSLSSSSSISVPNEASSSSSSTSLSSSSSISVPDEASSSSSSTSLSSSSSISVPDEASSSSSSTSLSSSSSISVPDEASSSSSSTSLSSSSSFSFSKGSLYDVFVSQRGEDTRGGFTSHLYKALTNAGVNVFLDDKKLIRGEDITNELERAIQGSKLSIVVFSREYARSTWCLKELVEIMKCQRTLGQLVLPIFYDCDPSHVRQQTGPFAQSFLKHTNKERVGRWRAALTDAANFSGWDVRNSYLLISSFMNSGFNVSLFTFGLEIQ